MISWDFIVIQWDINGIYHLVNCYITIEITIFMDKSIISLVNCYITNWKITMLLMGKSIISTAMASTVM